MKDIELNEEVDLNGDCSYWIECDICGRLDGNYKDEDAAYGAANEHRASHAGHKPKVESDC